MANCDENIIKSFDLVSERQLEIFATELQEHYYEERRLRTELETRNQELEQRVIELLSLNRLFQKFISQGFEDPDWKPPFLPGAEIPVADTEDAHQGPAKIIGEEHLLFPAEDDLNNA